MIPGNKSHLNTAGKKICKKIAVTALVFILIASLKEGTKGKGRSLW